MASGPITSWEIDGETVETVSDFIFWGSRITADGDCSHEIKRCLLLGRKVMTNLDNIFKSRDVTLPTKVHLVKAMVFPVVMYGCESWTLKKGEHRRIDAFELWCWRRLLRVPWSARRSNQSILKEISPGISLELKSLLMKVKEDSKKVDLKLNIQKTKIMAFSLITSWEIDVKTVSDFIFGGSQITADGDCSHEIKRRLLLGRKVMTNLDSIFKSRDITLPTKVRLVKAMVFPVVMYECESWTVKKAEH